MFVYYNRVVSTTLLDIQLLDTPLQLAASEGRTDTVAYLLQSSRVDVNTVTEVCEHVCNG